MKSIERFADLMRLRTEEEWRDQIFKLAHDLGYERTLLATFPNRNGPLEAESAFLHSNYSTEWRSKYDAKKMGYIDPTVSHCLNSFIPLIWTPEIFSAKKQKEMYEEACGHGIRSGVTLPIHGVKGELGILCFAGDTKPDKRFQQETTRRIPELSCFRDFIFETSFRFIPQPPPAEAPVSLTRRELECLKWSLAGKSSWVISQILRCTESNVNFHFSNIRRKFKTISRQQALVKAIRMGLICPD
ncbi:MAG: LuxR family transcriptional regulator [Sulfuricellaceae bacterium]